MCQLKIVLSRLLFFLLCLKICLQIIICICMVYFNTFRMIKYVYLPKTVLLHFSWKKSIGYLSKKKKKFKAKLFTQNFYQILVISKVKLHFLLFICLMLFFPLCFFFFYNIYIIYLYIVYIENYLIKNFLLPLFT